MCSRIRSCDALQPAPTKGDSGRETPVLLRGDDGSLAEGTVDLAFYEDTPDFVSWTVVDFKTDRKVETMSVYIAQVRVYSEAVRAATGSPARGIILVLVFCGQRMPSGHVR